MRSPQEALEGALNRATEIIWWNRSLTKLDQQDSIRNADTFVDHELVDSKGPYVEYVRTPKAHGMAAKEFLAGHDYHPLIIEATIDVLFDGDDSLPLYQHQAETIDVIEGDENDNVLAVPTATGKTEAFFLPILNHCLQTEEAGLKAIIVYPMKTLEVDQLNRFLRYLDRINRDLPGDKITIGIWDGDTDESVGTQEFQINAGSYVRGLECPRTGEKLRVKSDFNVGTDEDDYPWIRVTRRGIRSGVDILLTNPEALDNMYVNDKASTRGVIGNEPGEHPVKHIVFDEAHVWSGISGASISLLSRRLKSFFESRKPQITMVSATVSNPTELAASLTGSKPETINEVTFTEEPIPQTGHPDFSRLEPCSLNEVVRVILQLAASEDHSNQLREDNPDLAAAVSTLLEVGVLRTSPELELDPEVASWLLPPIEGTVESLLSTDDFDSIDDIVTSPEGMAKVVNRFLDSENVATHWKEFVIEQVPEVAELASLFETEHRSVQFRAHDELLEAVRIDGVDDPERVLSTVIMFGRLGRILTDKYHTFLKPPSKAYWCRECERIERYNVCSECGSAIPELQFCRTCHHPHVESERGDEAVFVPLTDDDPTTCPGCGESPDLQDINVPTSTLLTFMLTELCRLTPSKKTLVFNDSRSSAETIGGEIINTEYGLVAESLYVDELLDAGGCKSANDIYFDVSERLKRAYWRPLKDNAIDDEGATYEILEELREQIQAKASLHQCRHLSPAAIVTADALFDLSNPEALVIGHEVFDIFSQDPNTKFQRNRIKVSGLTYERISNKLSNRLRFDDATIDRHLGTVLARLCEGGFVHQPPWEEVEQRVRDSGESAEKIDSTVAYLEAARAELESNAAFEQMVRSGVFTRDLRDDDFDLRLVPCVAFCTNCYTAYPTPRGTSLEGCPVCGRGVDAFDRFDIDGSVYTGSGVADVPSNWNWELDHWANDISRPVTSDELEFISVGIHKGDVPASLRGAIEEAFRKSDPDVNIVSSTPTMELGVDIGTLDSVTQVGVPPTLTHYVQRSGRTGRSRGSSSIVTTVIRGDHPVDNHYYTNLDQFFSEFEPVRVPDPLSYDEVTAGHVFTETLGYLARNPDPRQVIERIYELDESALDLSKYQREVRRNLTILKRFVTEEPQRSSVERHLESIFGLRGVEVFDQIFSGEGPRSLDRRTKQTFETLSNVTGSSQAVTSLTEQYRRLDRWASLLGYLANYRGFGTQFPIKVKDRREDRISFETAGRLYEAFPGPENGNGAVFRLQGTKYIVTDVHASPDSLLDVAVCVNDDCDRPFESHDIDSESCPHCGEPLVETAIHPVGSVTCERAEGGRRSFSTYPITSLHFEETAFEQLHETSLFGLDCAVNLGEYNVTDFVYAFERYSGRGGSKETLISQAVVETGGDTDPDDPEATLDELLDDVDRTTYRPIGQQYHTRGLRIRFNREAFLTRYDRYADGHAEATWPQALVSFEQAIRKAATIVAKCDLDDFRIKVTDTGDSIDAVVVDSREGGNGITWQLFEAIREGSTFEDRVHEVASCNSCADYCDGCLLLSRTPPFYLEKNLLDKFALRAITGYDGPGSIQSIGAEPTES